MGFRKLFLSGPTQFKPTLLKGQVYFYVGGRLKLYPHLGQLGWWVSQNPHLLFKGQLKTLNN